MDPALHSMAEQGNVLNLSRLIAERPRILSSTTHQGNTALHIAAELGHAPFAKEVLGVDDSLLVSKNTDGDTPLHLAARAGKVDLAELLIDRSGAWRARTDQTEVGSSPLLMRNMYGDTPLHEAVKHRRGAIALKLIDAEPSSGHALNKKKQSPLYLAAREGLVYYVAKIVSDIPWVPEKFVPADADSGTALHQAVLGGFTRVVEILLDITPDEQIGLTDSCENNVLHYAVQKNKARVVKLLLNRKPDLAYSTYSTYKR